MFLHTYTGWVKKSKLLVLCQYINKTEKMGGFWTIANIYRENWALSDIFTENIYVTIVLCLILWLKAVIEITARQTYELAYVNMI